MEPLKGCLLVPTAKNADTGLWFIFHHESEGVLAFDLTTEHPDIPLRHFHTLLKNVPQRPGQTVLLGGPMQPDSAMLILHDNLKAGPDAHMAGKDFVFHSFRYVLVSGKPPALTRADDSAAHIDLRPEDSYQIIVGFRLWDMDILEQELKDWQWTILPATPEIVFRTARAERLEKARRMIN